MPLRALNAKHAIDGAVIFGDGRGGLPRAELTSDQGHRAEVYLFGGHVASWKDAAGRERLFMSRKAVFDGVSPLRGGVPLVFPQFAERGSLPKHGLVRDAMWAVEKTEKLDSGHVRMVLEIRDNDRLRKLWPWAFEVRLEVLLGASLKMTLTVANVHTLPMAFTCAFHTYFRVGDITRTAVENLKGCDYIDSAKGCRRGVDEAGSVRFAAETDRIYLAAPDELAIADEAAGRRIVICKQGLSDAVVWNPWVAKARALQDMADEEYRDFVCVETASIEPGVTLAPGAEWMGSQELLAE